MQTRHFSFDHHFNIPAMDTSITFVGNKWIGYVFVGKSTAAPRKSIPFPNLQTFDTWDAVRNEVRQLTNKNSVTYKTLQLASEQQERIQSNANKHMFVYSKAHNSYGYFDSESGHPVLE